MRLPLDHIHSKISIFIVLTFVVYACDSPNTWREIQAKDYVHYMELKTLDNPTFDTTAFEIVYNPDLLISHVFAYQNDTLVLSESIFSECDTSQIFRSLTNNDFTVLVSSDSIKISTKECVRSERCGYDLYGDHIGTRTLQCYSLSERRK